MSQWLERIRALSRDRRIVQHEPETPRYARARLRFDYILTAASVLGVRATEHPAVVEVALWAPPPAGRGAGFYSCIRVYLDESGGVVFAVLFCFWDGTERSRGFHSIAAATTHARQEGFKEDHAEDED